MYNLVSTKLVCDISKQTMGRMKGILISYALKHAGDLFLPSQIVPIIRLARSTKPYIVKQLETSEVYDFKEISKDLRILNERKDDQTGSNIN